MQNKDRKDDNQKVLVAIIIIIVIFFIDLLVLQLSVKEDSACVQNLSCWRFKLCNDTRFYDSLKAL